MGNKSILHNHFSYFNVTYLEYIFIKPILQLFHIFQTFLQYIIIKIFKHFYEIDTSHGNARTKVNSVSSSSTCRLKHQRMITDICCPIHAFRNVRVIRKVARTVTAVSPWKIVVQWWFKYTRTRNFITDNFVSTMCQVKLIFLLQNGDFGGQKHENGYNSVSGYGHISVENRRTVMIQIYTNS